MRFHVPFAFALITLPAATAGAAWERVELEVPSDILWLNAVAMNDAGQVVGTYFTETWEERSFLLEDGAFIDLGSLGGRFVTARSINERGEVVGLAEMPWLSPTNCWESEGERTCMPEVHAFVWRHGEIEDLGTFGFDSGASGINDAGAVVGGASTPGGFFAQRWQRDDVDLFGAFGGCNSSNGTALNERGQVIGVASSDVGQHAFLWDAGTGLRDLGTLGGPHSWAVAINGRGDVAVNGDLPKTIYCDEYVDGNGAPQRSCLHESQPFVWRDGRVVVIPRLGGLMSQAKGLNARGQIAGTSDTDAELYCIPGYYCIHRSHAFVWHAGKLVDLGEDGLGSSAIAINDLGDVLGWSEVEPGESRLVVWRERGRPSAFR